MDNSGQICLRGGDGGRNPAQGGWGSWGPCVSSRTLEINLFAKHATHILHPPRDSGASRGWGGSGGWQQHPRRCHWGDESQWEDGEHRPPPPASRGQPDQNAFFVVLAQKAAVTPGRKPRGRPKKSVSRLFPSPSTLAGHWALWGHSSSPESPMSVGWKLSGWRSSEQLSK